MGLTSSALNSLFIIFCSQLTSLITTFARNTVPYVEAEILLLMIAGGVGGALVVSQIVCKCKEKTMEKFFVGFLLVISAINVYNLIKYAVLA